MGHGSVRVFLPFGKRDERQPYLPGPRSDLRTVEPLLNERQLPHTASIPRASFLARLAAAASLPGAVLAHREPATAADPNGRRRSFERWVLDYQLTPNDLC